VYRFLGIALTSLVAVQSNIHPGPDFPGRVTLMGEQTADGDGAF